MCFGGGGPSEEEKQASVDQSLEADAAKREAKEKIAKVKREDISEALEARLAGEGRGGGGRRGRGDAARRAGGAAPLAASLPSGRAPSGARRSRRGRRRRGRRSSDIRGRGRCG